ncbi:hypothetical protein CesoFtcFv8_019093 [Champsocephalus esox]|uniref:Uncharacterized protein n=1 Tax=Champsocephalus esox TaxID=159716 RepID=A0AAN8GN56_9TELE|nr:hypothetical protein CesoFtcFv8_019093 [Champsocephalus esox]
MWLHLTSSPVEIAAPSGIMVVPADATLLMEGVAKGGYPVDITNKSTLDMTSIGGQSELECATALIESGLEPGAVAQLDVGYTVLETQESYSGETDFPCSITEVIRPMEMAELVDILPTLSLIKEEELPCDPATPSVMDMLESFGLGIGQSSFFDAENSKLISEAELQNESSSSSSSSHTVETNFENTEYVAVLETHIPSKVACFALRNQVEWDRPGDSSS